MYARMPVGAWLELDLLRRRRQQLGLVAPKSINSKQLLLRGSAIGGGFFVFILLICLALLLFRQSLMHRERELQPDVATYERYKKEVLTTHQIDQQLKNANRELAIAIAGLRSGSALLTEISRLVPRQVQLIKLQVNASSIKLSATSPQPLGLKRANVLQLLLEESPFFASQAVVLVNAIETISPTLGGSGRLSGSTTTSEKEDNLYLAFDIKADFSSDLVKLNRIHLERLGALGLARRVQLLEKEGLLR